jgi:hypothetical protein
MKNVSVNRAILVGKWLVLYPIFLITICGLFIGILYISEKHYGIKLIIDSVFVSGLIAWIYWGLTVTQWRIWAFKNVRNVHELYRKAIESNIISAENSFFEKTEIRSKSQKSKLKDLESKFLENDIYNDDLSIPDEIIAYHSKKNGIYLLLVGAFLTFCLYCIFDDIKKTDEPTLFYGIPMTLAAFFFGIKLLLSKKPQLIINFKGIIDKKGTFFLWEYIDSELIETIDNNFIANRLLVFFYGNRKISIPINDLSVNHHKLEKALQTYRFRYEKSKNPTT